MLMVVPPQDKTKCVGRLICGLPRQVAPAQPDDRSDEAPVPCKGDARPVDEASCVRGVSESPVGFRKPLRTQGVAGKMVEVPGVEPGSGSGPVKRLRV